MLGNKMSCAEETEVEAYGVVGSKLGISLEEFKELPVNERKEWVDACRLAGILNMERPSTLYEGYCNTDMYDAAGNFDYASATVIVRDKKRALDSIKSSLDVDLSPIKFILLGDKATRDFMTNAMQVVNNETAKDLDAGVESVKLGR